ncbi:CHAP1 protein, partial [Rhinopomastus cyanomelas]|nr:CHAP1 protein [Rhinopomastus cyanomelas]
MDVLQILRKTTERLDCDHCSFRGTDYENIQIHMGTIHPEYCDEMDAAGLGKLIFYQKSAKLFHCHKCFFTSKMYCNVYYHITAQHAPPEKWNEERKGQIGDSDSSKKSVTLEAQKTTLSPELQSVAFSSELSKSEPVVSPKLQKSSVSPEPQKLAQATSAEPEKSSQATSPNPEKSAQATSPDPEKSASAVSPVSEKQSPATSPNPQKLSPAVSPDAQKPAQAVSPDAQKPAQTVSPDTQKPAQTVSPDPQKTAQAVSPELRRHSPAVSPELRRLSPAISPEPCRHSPAVSPEPRRHSPAVSPEPRRHSPAVSPEPKKPTPAVSPEPRRYPPTGSPEPRRHPSQMRRPALASSPESRRPAPAVSPESWRPGPTVSPEPWRSASHEVQKSSTVSPWAPKPTMSVESRRSAPESRRPGRWKPVLSPDTWKHSPPVSPELRKSSHTVSSDWKPSFFPEVRKPGASVSPESWKLSESRRSMYFSETQKSTSAASSEVQKRAHIPEPRKRALFPESRKSNPTVSTDVQKRAIFSEPQNQVSTSSKPASPEIQKHGFFSESQKSTPSVSPEIPKQAVFTDSQKSAVSPDVQKHAVFSEMQKPAATPSESGESDFLSHSLDDQKPLDDLFSQDEQSILAKESPEDMLYSCPKKKPRKENQENSDSEMNNSECGKADMDSVEIKEQESNSDQEQYDMESSEYGKESKIDAAAPKQPKCVLQFTEEKEAFISEEEIAKYMKRGKGKYYCKICCCRAMKKGAVFHHLVNKHNVQSPYKCKICGKAFLLESLLKNHVAAHGQSLLKCPRCNFESNFPRGFKKHLTHCQSRHNDDTPKKHLDSLEPLEEQI